MKGSSWSKKYQLIIWSITLVVVVCALFFHFRNITKSSDDYSNSSQISSDAKEYDFTGQSLDTVDVDVDVADFDISYGDQFTVTCDFPEKYQPNVTLTNGKLTIKSKNKIRNLKTLDEWKLIVVVPEGTVLKSLDLDMDAGDIDVERLSSKQALISADAGSIYVSGVQFSDTEISADAGDIKVTDSTLGKIEVSADLGSIYFLNTDFSNGEISADMGDVDIDGDFESLKANCDVGSINISTSNPDEAILDLDCTLGEITVNGKSWK